MAAELAPGVLVVEAPLGERVSRIYVFTGDDASVVLDTGCRGDLEGHVLPALRAAGLDPDRVSHVVVSHCDVDHFGGLGDAARAFPRAERVAHRLDAPLMDVEVYLDRRAREFRAPHGLDEPDSVVTWSRDVASGGSVTAHADDGDRLDLGGRELEVLHVPGHSRGHLALWDEATGVLAVSDAVLGRYVPYADGSPSFPPTYRYPGDYRRTIRRLDALPFTVLATAHYPVEGPDSGRSLLARSLEFADDLERSILARCAAAAGPLTLREIVEAVEPDVAAWPLEGRAPALAQPVMGHLEQLAADGALVEGDSAGVPTWRSA